MHNYPETKLVQVGFCTSVDHWSVQEAIAFTNSAFIWLHTHLSIYRRSLKASLFLGLIIKWLNIFFMPITYFPDHTWRYNTTITSSKIPMLPKHPLIVGSFSVMLKCAYSGSSTKISLWLTMVVDKTVVTSMPVSKYVC